MENFKLDLRKLTPVAQEDRVKGNWYVVADKLYQYGRIVQWECSGTRWQHWFAIPPNLPGFPVAELPDEFELKEGDYQYYSDNQGKWRDISGLTFISRIKFRRIKPNLPELTIPEQTASERREWLQRELEKLEK